MKPGLLILAAGLGSRYGGMKQVESFGPSGETITDYSIYDAMMSGFGKIVFVISPAMEEEFASSYIEKFPESLEIDYVVQAIDSIPEGIDIHPERKKPWGTGHAVLVAASKFDEPFAVINADDFYGRIAYEKIATHLREVIESGKDEFCLAGYHIYNTLSDYGTVSRGVCSKDEKDYLTQITERTKIQREDGSIVFTHEDGGKTKLAESTPVSMNLFGFTPLLFTAMQRYFDEFIKENAMKEKAEFYLPAVVQRMMDENLIRTKVLDVDEKWFGVTYQEDRPKVLESINSLVKEGVYPDNLWRNFQMP